MTNSPLSTHTMDPLWFETDKARRQQLADQYWTTPLAVWGLSARTRNPLLRHNPAMSIGHVVMSGPEIASIRNVGPGILQELHAKVIELFKTGTTQVLPQVPVEPPFEQVEPALEGERLGGPVVLPSQVLNLPVHQLQLRACRALEHAGITTIGQLVHRVQGKRGSIPGVNSDAWESINRAVLSLQQATSLEKGTDWIRYYQLQDIHLIPDFRSENPSLEEVLRSLPVAFKDVLLREYDEKRWYILQRRYGLQSTEKLTLQELGDAFDISRERIRQLELGALKVLKRLLVEQRFDGKDYRVYPAVLQQSSQITTFATTAASELVLEHQLKQDLQQRYGTEVKHIWSEISLLVTLAGLQRHEFTSEDLDPFWAPVEFPNRDYLAQCAEELHRLFTADAALALDELDTLRHINTKLDKKKTRKLTLAQLRLAKRICSSIEERPDGSLWGKFEYLQGRGNQVERLLFEAGEPLSIHVIVRRLNNRLVKWGQRKVGMRNLRNQLSNDDRFVTIGGSGYWGLKAWPNIETATVEDLMEQYLTKLDRPATRQEINRYVSERRQVQDSSIGIYLSANDKFRRMSQTTWGLASWPEAKNASVWDRTQVAGFLVQLFKDRKASELEYSEVKQALARAANISEEGAQSKLRNNRVLRTRKDVKSGQRIAFLRPENIENLPSSRSRSTSAKPTGRELIQAAVRRLLIATPDHAIPMRELMAAVQKELGSKEKTVYRYIAEMDDVKRVMLPESQLMICRLKTTPKPPAYPQVLQIATPELRVKVERTIPYLTVDDVDVGLFLLSKEFEATVRGYLNDAIKAGKLPSTLAPEISKKNLNWMIDLVAKEGLITDKSVPNMLREERNARAHGSMPSPAERQVLMNNAPYLAALYIDYIRLFDDLRRGL